MCVCMPSLQTCLLKTSSAGRGICRHALQKLCRAGWTFDTVVLLLQARAADTTLQDTSQWSAPTSLQALLHQLDTCKVAVLPDNMGHLSHETRDVSGILTVRQGTVEQARMMPVRGRIRSSIRKSAALRAMVLRCLYLLCRAQ